MIQAGVRTTAVEMHSDGEVVARIPLGLVDSPFPYSVTIAQTETGRILTKALAEYGVPVERGVTLTGLTQDEHGVGVMLEHAGGDHETARTGWLVGADGRAQPDTSAGRQRPPGRRGVPLRRLLRSVRRLRGVQSVPVLDSEPLDRGVSCG